MKRASFELKEFKLFYKHFIHSYILFRPHNFLHSTIENMEKFNEFSRALFPQISRCNSTGLIDMKWCLSPSVNFASLIISFSVHYACIPCVCVCLYFIFVVCLHTLEMIEPHLNFSLPTGSKYSYFLQSIGFSSTIKYKPNVGLSKRVQ